MSSAPGSGELDKGKSDPPTEGQNKEGPEKKKKKDKDKKLANAVSTIPIPAEHEAFVRAPEPRVVLVPPLNFGMVAPGVYRSGYPNSKNFPFMKKLRFKSIVYLCPEAYLDPNQEFVAAENIRVFQFHIEGNLEPLVEISQTVMNEALSHIVDQRNYPILVHCQKGNHRTGCLVGCLRRLMNWSLSSTLMEYRRYTGSNVRLLDMQYIELFKPQLELAALSEHCPPWVKRFQRHAIQDAPSPGHQEHAGIPPCASDNPV